MGMQNKKVKHLQPGDLLSSGATILERYDSVKCPKGKINVRVQYSNGGVRTQQWNKETVVGLK